MRRRVERRGPGRLLPFRLGRYELFDHIGRGGMADIYRARMETSLGGDRQVVIKEVLPELSDLPKFAELLASEAKLASSLTHQNIVQVEDLGRHDGVLYIAMEYVEGLDLRELLRGCAKKKLALPVDLSLRIVSDILRALDVAHRARIPGQAHRGIIHRDVSPSNVLLSFEGEVKLCDFGIARAAETELDLTDEPLDPCEGVSNEAPIPLVKRVQGGPALLRAEVEGKAGYMSPEQAGGRALDGRSDLFATGILLWEMLAGRRLYRAQSDESLLAQAQRADVPELPSRNLPNEDELFAIVGSALAFDPSVRWPTAGAMLEALEEWIHKSGYFASPLKLRDFLGEHFAPAIVAARRARERAVEALRRGPPAIIIPIRSKTPAPPAVAPGPAAVEVAGAEPAAEPPEETLTATESAPSIPSEQAAVSESDVSTKPRRARPEDPPPSLSATTTDLDSLPPAPKPKTSPWSLIVVALVIAAMITIALLRG